MMDIANKKKMTGASKRLYPTEKISDLALNTREYYQYPSPQVLDSSLMRDSKKTKQKNNASKTRYTKRSHQSTNVTARNTHMNNPAKAGSNLSSITISEWQNKAFTGPGSREAYPRNTFGKEATS